MLRSNLEEVQLCLTAGERSEPAGKRFLLTPTPTGSNRMHVGKFDPFEVAQGQAIDTAGAASRTRRLSMVGRFHRPLIAILI